MLEKVNKHFTGNGAGGWNSGGGAVWGECG